MFLKLTDIWLKKNFLKGKNNVKSIEILNLQKQKKVLVPNDPEINMAKFVFKSGIPLDKNTFGLKYLSKKYSVNLKL